MMDTLSESISPLLSISRDTFRKSPLEMQIEYAVYHKLPNAENLSTKDISAALYTDNEWIPALEGHVSLSTPNGPLVSNNVVDLVDWIVTEQSSKDRHSCQIPSTIPSIICLPTTEDTESPLINETHRTWLLTMADDLLRQCERIKARNEEAHLAVQKVTADVFELQARLANRLSSFSSIMHAVERVVGEEVAQQTEENVQSAMKEVDLKSLKKSDLQLGRDREQGHDENPTFRVGTGAIISSDTSHTVHVPSKRTRENDVNNVERSHCTPSPTGLPDHTSDSVFPPQLERDGAFPPGFRLKSPGSSQNGSSDDSSYSPSSGTDSSVMGSSEPFEVASEFRRMEKCTLSTDEEISGEESSGKSNNGVPWNAYVVREIDESDGNYSPPPWNREYLMDLDKEHRDVRAYYRRQSVDHYTAMEEAFLGGQLSSSGLTTDDSEEGYHNASSLQYSTELREEALNEIPNDHPDSVEYALRSACRDFLTTTEEEDTEIIERWKDRRWNNLLHFLKDPDFARCDLDGRISEIFTSNRWRYEFNNDSDWRWFEKSGL